jgi:hypothetical protein
VLFQTLFLTLLLPNLTPTCFGRKKNARNSAIPINNTEFLKTFEKNTLKKDLEEKKGANQKDLL